MAKTSDALVSLTTRIPPREYLAIGILSKARNQTPSEWLRIMICNDVEIVATPVPEEELIQLKSAVIRKRKPQTLWQRFRAKVRAKRK